MMDTGTVDKNGKMLVMFDTGSAQVMSPKGNFRSTGHIGQKALDTYDYFVMDIGGDDIQDAKIQKRLQKMIDKYVVPNSIEDEEMMPNSRSRKSDGDPEKKVSSSARSGPSFYDFPDCLKGTEWLKYIKPCKEGESRRVSGQKKGKQKAAEKKREELILAENEKEQVGDGELALTPEDEEKAWESLRQSGFLEHIDENDPKLIAKNKGIAAMNKFKLHPIKKQLWDIRKALDGTRPVTRQEVAFHCDNGDILLIRNRRVINAMNIVISHFKEHQDKILPLIKMKGTDISHWFNPITGEPRTKVDLKTGKRVLHTPNGFYYGLGPIRRQLELKQEEEAPSPSIKSSLLTDLNEGAPAQVESDLSKDYEAYQTNNLSDLDVSGFEPPKRHSVFSDPGYKTEEMDGEDMEMPDEGAEEGETGEEFESGENEFDEEEDIEEMEENIGRPKSKKNSMKSSGSEEVSDGTPGTGSSPKDHARDEKSNPNSPENASPDDPANHSRHSISRGNSNSSNPNLSPIRSKKSITDEKSPMRVRSEGKEEGHEKHSNKTEHKNKPNSNETDAHEHKSSAEDKSGETGSNSTSPHTMSPKDSTSSNNRKKSKVASNSSQEEEDGEYFPSEDESDEAALEEVLSHISISQSFQSVYAAEGSQFDGAMSTIPQMGSEHSLLSEVASVYSKTTVDTTAIASTVYGVQTDVFPGVSWTVHDPNYEEKWWLDPKYLCGYIPKSTLNIRIINSLSYDERVLVISKEYTINDIMRYYLPYNHNAMGYSWEDMFGNVLHPDRTVVENGLIDMALADDNGFNAYPVIILVFIDGFEDEPIVSLNPKELSKQIIPICRNY